MSNSVPSTSWNTDTSKKKADNRADLIRRLFAVAISVGFASTLVQMDWIKEGRLPNWIEAGQLFALVTALIATVLSWDAYLLAIKERPLTNPLRFAIDMVLIFTYMLLLIVSKHAKFFLPTLAVIFVLYVLWSMLTVRDYIVQYDKRISISPAPISKVFGVYLAGFLNTPGIRRNPVITLSWAVYFVALAAITELHSDWLGTACVFALIGLISYRLDNAYGGFERKFGIISIAAVLLRACSIGAVLLLAFLYYSLG